MHTTIHLPDDLYEKLREYAFKRRQTMSAVVRDALEFYQMNVSAVKVEPIVRSDKPFPTEADVDRELAEIERIQDENIAKGMDFVSANKAARRKVKGLPKVLPRK